VSIVLVFVAGDADGDVVARFAALAAAAAIAQLFGVDAPRNQTYHTTVVFLLASVLLLPAALLPAVAIVQHVPEWLKNRHRLRYTIFNTANHTLDMLAAAGVVALIPRSSDVGWALAGGAAVVTLVALNHVLLAIVISLTRGYMLRETGLFTAESLAADVVPAALGIAIAAFWLTSPLLVLTAAIPLALIQRALAALPKQLQATLA
jgi:hypothetical protein